MFIADDPDRNAPETSMNSTERANMPAGIDLYKYHEAKTFFESNISISKILLEIRDQFFLLSLLSNKY